MANIYHVTTDFQGVPTGISRALLIADNGSFMMRRLAVAGQVLIEAITRIGEGWPDDGLAPLPTGDQARLQRENPWHLVAQTISFFKAVYDRFSGEAIVLLFYAPSATRRPAMDDLAAGAEGYRSAS